MSSATPQSAEAAAFRRAEKTLSERLRKTQIETRRVDVFSAICAFATFGLGVLFLGILFDHWILPNGFSSRGRLVFCVFWALSTAIFFALRLVPALRRRVNPLFAAKTLEDGWKDAHNSAINWLQLRKKTSEKGESTQEGQYRAEKSTTNAPSLDATLEFDALERAILRGVALQAAQKAESAPPETSVDCAPLIRWGIALAVVVAVCAGYSVFSPKNPFASAGRLAAPLAEIERPQAIRFAKITPGDVSVFQGDSIDVDAEIPGAGTLPVVLLYSTEDGRLTDREIPMNALGGSRFQAKFPDSEVGFEENLTYRVVVGRGTRFESRAPIFRVDVRPRPSLRVEKTTLNFPEYAGLAPQTFENQGDVRALEGTVVEIVARSNVPLKSAFFLPDGDETRAKSMKISPENPNLATFSFRLDWKSSDSGGTNGGEKTPEFSSFRLRSEDEKGEKNRDENLYSVETLPDVPPTIRWDETPGDAAEIPFNDLFRVRVEAEDPDFSLRAVRLRTAIRDLNEGANGGRPNPEPLELLSSASATGPTPFVGARVLSAALVPEEIGLQVGDEIEYWAEAVDSKRPDAGVATTEKRLFVVGAPVENPSSDEEPQNDDDRQRGESGESGEGGRGDDRQNGESDADSNDGKSVDDARNDDAEKTGNSGETNSKENDSNLSDSDSGRSEPNPKGNAGENAPSSAQSPQNPQDKNQRSPQTPPKNDSGAAKGATGSAENQNASEKGETGGAAGGQGANTDENSSGGATTGGDSNSQSDQRGESGSRDGENSDASGESTSENGSGSSGGPPSDASSNAPIDPETNPGDAFEKMLDYIDRQNAQNSPENAPGSAFDSNESDGESKGDSGFEENLEADENDPTAPRNPEQNADSERASDEKSSEKRALPTRTSAERPSADAERFQASESGAFDPNAKREKGDVDPNSNRFLAQNADANDRRPPKTAPSDASVDRDPLDDSPETPGDAPDPNAREGRDPNGIGNSGRNGASDAPFDVVREGENADADSETDDVGVPQNPPPLSPGDLPADAALGFGGNGNGSDGPSPGAVADRRPPTKGAGVGSADDRAPQNSDSKRSNPTAGGSASDSPSGVRGGGGGGSGLGELAGDDANSIAPADAPTLQYAEKATNLVLERLENDLKKRVDPRLLAELGWTEDELRDFLERWKKMRDAAADSGASGDSDAKKRYLQALENVGLAPEVDRAVDATLERPEDLARPRSAEAARRALQTKTPSALEERVRAFRRGVSGGGRDAADR